MSCLITFSPADAMLSISAREMSVAAFAAVLPPEESPGRAISTSRSLAARCGVSGWSTVSSEQAISASANSN
ncbi:hypothetical protein AALK14_14765 [Butyricimonas hominis]|uniref:Uncharacterized protein n=1 Tax=Butyricimonas hominis TaxID=2763032 RepID=A0ABR7D0K6_9BACT|nr:hypothetical protein [Butyricimonas hominis]MBC5621442.1 hypothetical protein [Butyricimonas hominis]